MRPKLKLIGENGNAYVLLGLARRCAQKHGMDWDAIRKEATSGDYSHLLSTLSKYFRVY